jgi:hypothetical protein
VVGIEYVVLYDIETGHDDPAVETRIDEVGFEYLDLLLDLTADDYLGTKPVVRPSTAPSIDPRG